MCTSAHSRLRVQSSGRDAKTTARPARALPTVPGRTRRRTCVLPCSAAGERAHRSYVSPHRAGGDGNPFPRRFYLLSTLRRIKLARPGADERSIGSLLDIVMGTGLAVAVVLAFWLLVGVIDDMLGEARKVRR